MLERFEAALGHVERGLAVSRAAGTSRVVVPLLLGRVEPELGLGRVARATDAAQAAVEAGRVAGAPQYLSWALWTHAYAEIHAGDVHRAVALADEAAAAAAGLHPNVLAGADPGWTLGEALVEAGEAEHGHAVLLDAVGGAGCPRVSPVDRPLAWERLAHAALERGDRDAARAYADRARTAAAALTDLHVPVAAAARAHAAVLLADGAAATAAAVAQDALGRPGLPPLDAARL